MNCYRKDFVRAVVMVLCICMMLALSKCNRITYAGDVKNPQMTRNGSMSQNIVSGNIIKPEIEGLVADSSDFVKGYTAALKLTLKFKKGSYAIDEAGFGLMGPFASEQETVDIEDMKFVKENYFLIKENGYYVFAIRDIKGNVTTCATRVTSIDREPPVISNVNVEFDDSVNGYGKAGTLVVAAYDTKSRLATEAFSFDDGQSYGESCRLRITENGVYTIRVRDNLGNIIRKKVEVSRIDNQAPTMVMTCDEESTFDSTVVNFSLVDTKSGLGRFWYIKDGDETEYVQKEFEGIINDEINMEIAENGKYIFFITDRLGNLALSEANFTKLGTDSENKAATATSEASSEIIKKKSSSTKSRKTSSSAKTIVVGGDNTPDYMDAGEDEKKVVIKSKENSGQHKGTLSEMAPMKTIITDDDWLDNDEEEFEAYDEEELEGVEDFVNPSMFYGLDTTKESAEHLMEEYLGAAPEIEKDLEVDNVTVSAPSINRKAQVVDEVGGGKIALMAIGIIVFLFAATLFWLNKKGIIDVRSLIEKFKPELREEEEETDEEDEF